MSTKKTIQINPELFRINGNRTRKAREKKDLVISPIVSPNNLKNKLLKRIKEHKTNEMSKSNLGQNSNSNSNSNSNDEFNNALNYLSGLSKNKKRENAVQQQLHNKTLRNSPSLSLSLSPSLSPNSNMYMSSLISNTHVTTSPYVSLDLPSELQEPMPSATDSIMNIKYNAVPDVPYGCLKGGSKPSYRSWIQTRKNIDLPDIFNINTNPININARPPTPPKRNPLINSLGNPLINSLGNPLINSLENPLINSLGNPLINSLENPLITPSVDSSREQRLEQIKNKLRKIQEQENGHKPEVQNLARNLSILEPISQIGSIIEDLPPFDEDTPAKIQEILTDAQIIEKKAPELKKYIKRTIRRKFTLGRSDKMRRVGVLIKDKQTRKNVINAQKELKKTSITDVRKYLRQHGIIKVGSTAPNDILRKTFESAMLAGEVTNNNKDVLLHNFLNEE
jgi:virulence-associated protein VagC